MIKNFLHLLLFCLTLSLPWPVQAQAPQRVTIDNFARAETDHYFATYVAQGALGRFFICAMSPHWTSRAWCV